MIPQHIKDQFPLLAQYGVNSKLRLAHFLAQVSHESGNFTKVEENLKYSDANRIALIFKNDVDTDDDRVVEPHEIEFAKKFVKNPVALANFVYANQNGNGDEASGDGWKYRGRGYIQLTGKSNYEAFGKFIQVGILSDPDLVATKYPLLSAAWFFNVNGINKISDLGSTIAVVTSVTKRVNGGTHGLTERFNLFSEYYKELNKA